jgi:Protein of unknown function (DUF2911)
MRKALAAAAFVAAGALVVAGAGQKTTEVHPGKGGSPHVKSEWTIDGASIAIAYGRPSLKGRTPGKDVDPYPGKPWRTGADEATTITTDKALKFGSISLEPGTYTVNTQPGEGGWQLIFGKLGKPGQWGIPYNASLEIGRTPMTVAKTKAPVEQLTISIDDTATGGALRIEWGAVSATAPFTVG